MSLRELSLVEGAGGNDGRLFLDCGDPAGGNGGSQLLNELPLPSSLDGWPC